MLGTVIERMTAWWKLIGKTELIERLDSDLRPGQRGQPEDEVKEVPVPTEPTRRPGDRKPTERRGDREADRRAAL